MTAEILQAIAATNEWAAIGPELALGLLAIALLLLELVLPKGMVEVAIPRVAVWGQVAVLVWALVHFNHAWMDRELFGGMLRFTSDGQLWRLFFLLGSILVCHLATISLRRQPVPRVEFYHILLVATGAMMLLAQSNHFVMLFVALETVTVALYILVSYFRHRALTLEAGLKYLVTGALSSALLLFGIVLLYGAASNPHLEGHSAESMNFTALRLFLALNPGEPIALVGALLAIAGVAFKIGAVPFQIWIPDVYQGAPTPVTAFLGVSSKAAGFAVLLALVKGPFVPILPVVLPALSIMAVLSLVFGNLAALTQRNVKRLMGLSGISHAGFLLIGVVASTSVGWASGAVMFYLLTYLLGSMAVFAVMAHVAGEDDADQEFRHYADLARRRPLLGAALAVGLGSLAGIPPLAGFMGKLLVFVAAFQAQLWLLLGVAIAAVVVSIYYYFGWIRAAFFDGTGTSERTAEAESAPGLLAGVTLIVLSLAIVALGFYQGPLGHWLAMR